MTTFLPVLGVLLAMALGLLALGPVVIAFWFGWRWFDAIYRGLTSPDAPKDWSRPK